MTAFPVLHSEMTREEIKNSVPFPTWQWNPYLALPLGVERGPGMDGLDVGPDGDDTLVGGGSIPIHLH